MTTYDEVISLAEQVLSDLTTRDLKLAIAESCTGGLISSLLTDLEGSSDVLQYSIVAYTQESKEEFLGVPTHVTHNYGTVSLECAKIMAEGVTIYEADIGLATTGVIGESLEGKLKGTVFIAIAYKGRQTFAQELTLNPKKTRHELKLEIAKILLTELMSTTETIY